jgi:hypothetical protein
MNIKSNERTVCGKIRHNPFSRNDKVQLPDGSTAYFKSMLNEVLAEVEEIGELTFIEVSLLKKV